MGGLLKLKRVLRPERAKENTKRNEKAAWAPVEADVKGRDAERENLRDRIH